MHHEDNQIDHKHLKDQELIQQEKINLEIMESKYVIINKINYQLKISSLQDLCIIVQYNIHFKKPNKNNNPKQIFIVI